MLGFLTRRAPNTRPLVRRPVRLGVEQLEARELLDATPLIPIPIPIPTPMLTLSVSYGAGKVITLSGDLMNVASPANREIAITGMATGSTTTDTSGHYSVTLTASALGFVLATEPVSLAMNSVFLVDAAPMLTTFQATCGTGNLWTFSGMVTYRAAGLQELIITFGGAPISVSGQTTTVNSSGVFSICIQLDGTTDDNGLVSARTTSPYGVLSNTVYTNVLQA